MLLAEVVETSAAVSSTPSRLAKIHAIADRLSQADPDEIAIVVGFLSGQLGQRRLGLGWAALRDMPEPEDTPSLHIVEVDRALSDLEKLSGSGSQMGRRQGLNQMLARATSQEQRFLAALLSGELRQGALGGIMIDAVAEAANVPAAAVRRASMIGGDLPATAERIFRLGSQGLDELALTVGQPVQPMLARSADSLSAALEGTGPASIEWKLDGVRVQVHRRDQEVQVFTRTLEQITDRVPEVVEAALACHAKDFVLDGEVLALRSSGRPRPFQETGSRVARRGDPAALRTEVPLTPFFFDILHLNAADLIDLPLSERLAMSLEVVPSEMWVPRRVADQADDEAHAFLEDALAKGHEGVVAKSLNAKYEAGRRGVGWIKVKPHHTLDLVVLAAEWGHGRRHGWLSNLHLGARDTSTGEFVMLGKTFKGLTDQMLRWQTERLLGLETRRDRWTVYVRPELVVEIAFDGIQRSRRYPGGMALRFARVARYRLDKRPDEADAIDTVRALHSG